MHIIGLCGFAGSGKSTAAEFFVREYGFTRLSFAAAVKDITAILFGWDRHRLEGETPQDREWRERPDKFWSSRLDRSWSPRTALQFVGTDLCRTHVHPNIWVDRIIAHIHQIGPDATVVIDDVRFINELALLRNVGAHIAIVQRRYDDGTVFPTPEHARVWHHAPALQDLEVSPKLHASEWNWMQTPDIKHLPILMNDGSYDTFYATLRTWYTTTQ